MKSQRLSPVPMQLDVPIDYAITGTSILNFVAETEFLVLLLLAIVGHHVSQQFFGKSPWRPAAKFLSLPFAVYVGIHFWNNYPILVDVEQAFGTLARWGLGWWLANSCFALPTMYVTHLLVRYVQREWARLEEFSKGLQEWHSTFHQVEPPPQQVVAPPPREVNVFRNSEQARLDYEFECRIVREADLQDEEREAALNQAKQKYLQRLSQVLQ